MLSCCRCGRRIIKSAVTVTSTAGPSAYGPRCAEVLGLLADERQSRLGTKRRSAVIRKRRQRGDSRQLQLLEGKT